MMMNDRTRLLSEQHDYIVAKVHCIPQVVWIEAVHAPVKVVNHLDSMAA